jgi:hypothetical protein
MAYIVYGLCTLTAFCCAWLLLQAYRRNRYRLLFWSGLCFAGLTGNNFLLFIDKLVLPAVDLSLWRTGIALMAMLVLLYGLVWDAE